MEQLTQKYIKYFYIILLIIISVQLASIIFNTLMIGYIRLEVFGLMFLSILNIMVLSSSIKHNIKQQFTECKCDAMVLRFTLGILIIFHMTLLFIKDFSFVMFTDYLSNLIGIEIVLSFRIKSIEHLEKMANQFVNKTI